MSERTMPKWSRRPRSFYVPEFPAKPIPATAARRNGMWAPLAYAMDVLAACAVIVSTSPRGLRCPRFKSRALARLFRVPDASIRMLNRHWGALAWLSHSGSF